MVSRERFGPHMHEVNLKASYLFKWLIACLLLAVAGAVALFSGVGNAKPVVFFFVIAGAMALLVGLMLLATGNLTNDITRQDE